MARRVSAPLKTPAPRALHVADEILDQPEESILDLLDRLLNKGVMLDGDITLGVAGVDLVYLRLSSIFCAADRVLPQPGRRQRRRVPPPPIGRRARP
jgi:gas vesicle structural protein